MSDHDDFDDFLTFLDDMATIDARRPAWRRWLAGRSVFGYRLGYVVRHPSKLVRGVRSAVRHRVQRAQRGMSTQDVWDYCSTNARMQVDALTRLRDMNHGHPSSLNSCEEWAAVIDRMIDGFQAQLDLDDYEGPPAGYVAHLDACLARLRDGLAVYAEWYPHLWD